MGKFLQCFKEIFISTWNSGILTQMNTNVVVLDLHCHALQLRTISTIVYERAIGNIKLFIQCVVGTIIAFEIKHLLKYV